MPTDLTQLAALGGLIYVLVFVVVALDALVPVMPSESIVVTAAVLAASGAVSLPLVLLAATVGALGGDAASFLLGRRSGRRRRAAGTAGRSTGRTAKAVRWAGQQLDAHGPGVLIVARFIPGGRTAATFTAGFTGMGARRFGATAAAGALLWAGQATIIGFAGGRAFEGNLVLGITLGVGSGIAVGLLVEVARHRFTGRAAARFA
ncbi:DedA family protein [soil metagenome]